MKLKIDEIRIGSRIRHDPGDLTILKQSIQSFGLIHPVIVNEDYELLSGYRRLQACKELGLREIEVKVVSTGNDPVRKLDWEYHENLGRRNLTEEDRLSYLQEREKLLAPSPKKGLLAWLGRLWQKLIGLFRRG